MDLVHKRDTGPKRDRVYKGHNMDGANGTFTQEAICDGSRYSIRYLQLCSMPALTGAGGDN